MNFKVMPSILCVLLLYFMLILNDERVSKVVAWSVGITEITRSSLLKILVIMNYIRLF
jgi:hypothetical protein